SGGLLADVWRFHDDAHTPAGGLMSTLAAPAGALCVFFLARAMPLRELSARRQVEALHAQHESRGAARGREVVRRARGIEGLNARLNEQIRERSRELSIALARIAEGHRGLEPGTVLGQRVAIEAQLGRGGMGIVYRGRDLVTNTEVAVKVVQAGSAQELD